MKKTIAGILTGMLMGTLLFSGSAMAAEDITGEWYLVEMAEGGESFNPSDFGMEIIMTVNEDGTVSIDSLGETTEGTWKEDGDGWILSTEDDEEGQQMALQDDFLILTQEGEDISMTFSREAPETAVQSPVVSDVSLEDFNGTWVMDAISMGGMRLPADMLGGNAITITIDNGSITYHVVSVSEEDAEAESEEAESEEAEFTVDGVFADGILSVEGSEETAYVSLKLQLHEDGSMSDGYTELSEEEEADAETEAEAESETEDLYDESFLDSIYTIYVKSE